MLKSLSSCLSQDLLSGVCFKDYQINAGIWINDESLLISLLWLFTLLQKSRLINLSWTIVNQRSFLLIKHLRENIHKKKIVQTNSAKLNYLTCGIFALFLQAKLEIYSNLCFYWEKKIFLNFLINKYCIIFSLSFHFIQYLVWITVKICKQILYIFT